MSRRNLLLTLSILILLIIASLFLFPSFRSFLTSRVLPIPPVTETMVGGRLAATPLPGPHTLTYEARTSSGQTITDSVTFTQPNPSTSPTPQCNNNGIPEAGEACDTGPNTSGPTTRDYCSSRCQVELDVTEYGATKDTPGGLQAPASESDTLQIQKALDTAKGLTAGTYNPAAPPVLTPPTFNPPNTKVTTVFFPTGRYDVTQLHPWYDTTLIGEGPTEAPTSIIKRLDNRPNEERMLSTHDLIVQTDAPIWTYAYRQWVSDVDSPPLTIRNLTVDGNRQGQAPRWGMSGGGPIGLQFQSILFASAAGTTKPGKIKIVVEDSRLMNAGNKAIQVYKDADVTVRRVVLENNYIGLNDNGTRDRISAEDVTVIQTDFTMLGDAEQAIDLEPASTGYQNNWYSFKRWRISDGTVTFWTTTNSTLEAEDIVSTFPGFHTNGSPGSSQVIRNSSFVMGQRSDVAADFNGLAGPENITFYDTEFIVSEKDSESPDGQPIALLILWNWSNSTHKNQSVTCNNCTFTTDDSIDPTDTPIAIKTTYDYKSWNNVLKINGGSISSDFKEGLKMVQGGTWDITGMDIQSSNIPSVVPDIHVRSSGPIGALPTGEKTWYDVQLHQITPSDVVIWQYEPTDPNNSYVKD